MTPQEQKFIDTIKELVALQEPNLIIFSEHQKHSYCEIRNEKVYLVINPRHRDNPEAKEALAMALARTFDRLNELREIKAHELSHPHFEEQVLSIIKWSPTQYNNECR